ncbi:MAG: DUF2782 domain-containing protein [Ectothiorhodospiraceae bacterium]|nr:DUF2782 domain-containing protein [Ectothiorhodospiraceae bacterium]
MRLRFVQRKVVQGMAIALLIGATSVSAEEGEPTGEVTIQNQSEGIVEEKRVNGRLYAIRVTPRKGVPYYLVDSDGDGDLETRRNDTDSDLLIPAWVIKQW